MELPTISKEQNDIIELLKNNNNVIVESVAGSGKTTSNLYIAKSLPNYNILLLTYNAKLKIETREKIEALNIKNLETHSYHSFCVKYYNPVSYTDTEIKKIIINKTEPKIKLNYDLVILDESQDITPLYYDLICKILKDNNKSAQLCLLGDRYQNVYDFNDADSRFMIYADKLFNFNKLNWARCKLSQSYRITSNMAKFINNCLMNTEHIKSDKVSNHKPNYIICNTFDKKPFEELKRYLGMGYKPDDIFILAPSVKNDKSPVRTLENLIKKYLDIPVYVPTSDDEKLDADVIKNKLIFSTFHQAKGLERKVVITFSFDDSYFKFFKKDKNPLFCPNEIYVAATRALEHLTVYHHNQAEHFKFANINKLKTFCNYIEKDKIRKSNTNGGVQIIQVADLLKHLPAEIIDNCINYININKVKEATTNINVETKVKDKDGYENVSEITGVAIPSYFEYINTKKMTIYEDLKYKQANENKEIPNFDKIELDKITENELLYLANYYCAYRSGFLYKTYQITNYDWITKEQLLESIKNLNTLNITNNAIYEQSIEIENKTIDKCLVGYIDCIDENNIYEFKCVQKIEKTHILQLAIYMFMIETRNRNVILQKYKEKMEKNNKSLTNKIATKGEALKYINKYKTKNDLVLKNINELNATKDIINNYLLYNILSDELLKIESDYDKISQMIKYLIEYKYKHNITKSDNDFINNFLEVSSKYFNDIVIDKSKSEDITKDVQIIKSDKIILDIETDGFDNIIQVAYKMYDTDMKVIKIKNIYINDGIHFTDYYKRISKETIVNKGITPKEASKILYNDINNTNILIGHNIKSFDYEKIKNYINRYYNDKFKDTIIFHDTCTNDKICSIVGAKNKNNRIKKPRLEELYKFLFPDENIITDSTHTADYDVEITEKCYNKIQSEYKLF
jgi:hypothetical protein